MFERFTSDSLQALKLSRAVAEEKKAAEILPDDLLVGIALLEPPPSILQASASTLRSTFTLNAVAKRPLSAVPLSTAAQRLLNVATAEADALGHHQIRPEHFVLALLKDSHSSTVLRDEGIDEESVLRALTTATSVGAPPPSQFTVTRHVKVRTDV
jgi:ATP-dependent Clp protease ATP-binding subunit ClpA